MTTGSDPAHPGFARDAGAVRDLSGEGSAQDGLSNSRYLTTYGVAFSQDGRTVYVGEAYKNRVLAVDVALGASSP